MKRSTTMLMAALILPGIYSLFGPYNWAWAGSLGLFILLAACYWLSIKYHSSRKLFISIQVGIAAVIGALYSPWNLVLGFYPAMVAGIFLSQKSIRVFTGLASVSFAASVFFYYEMQQQEWQFYWVPLVITVLFLPFVVKIYHRSMIMNQELKVANEEITYLIKNEERQRISRDLHDSVGHTLSLITLKSELMERLIREHPEEAIEEANAIQEISRSVLLQVRQLISDMQSVDIEEELEHAVDVFSWADIAFHRKIDCAFEKIPPITRNILGMCLRECITNVLKHSGAKTCTVTLHGNGREYILIIEDDGKGMSLHNEHQKNFGSGIVGMKERLLLIGGTLHIDSAEGTDVTITVPKMG
ncbi:sensor histidine kinase [Halobacillus sp. H74]|uniref:sensor histidine kinase n=1 Tax=Halobacillus sp. H74 TaxID=3457436 RepID=UPI003FCC5F15